MISIKFNIYPALLHHMIDLLHNPDCRRVNLPLLQAQPPEPRSPQVSLLATNLFLHSHLLDRSMERLKAASKSTPIDLSSLSKSSPSCAMLLERQPTDLLQNIVTPPLPSVLFPFCYVNVCTNRVSWAGLPPYLKPSMAFATRDRSYGGGKGTCRPLPLPWHGQVSCSHLFTSSTVPDTCPDCPFFAVVEAVCACSSLSLYGPGQNVLLLFRHDNQLSIPPIPFHPILPHPADENSGAGAIYCQS